MTRYTRKKPLIAICKPTPKKKDVRPYLLAAMILTLFMLTLAGIHY